MTAKDLIKVLANLPELDVELKINFSYYTLDCNENELIEHEDHIVTGVTTDGTLKTERTAWDFEFREYETPEPPEYYYDEEYEDEILIDGMTEEDIAWIGHNGNHDDHYPFENGWEEEGYWKYVRTLQKQDEDLAELVKIAHNNALDAQLEELNSDLDCWLC